MENTHHCGGGKAESRASFVGCDAAVPAATATAAFPSTFSARCTRARTNTHTVDIMNKDPERRQRSHQPLSASSIEQLLELNVNLARIASSMQSMARAVAGLAAATHACVASFRAASGPRTVYVGNWPYTGNE